MRMTMVLVAVLCALCVQHVCASAGDAMLDTFTASFTAFYPSMPQKGVISGQIYFSATRKVKVLVYNAELQGITEFYDYANKALYRYDSVSCSGYNLKADMEVFTATSFKEISQPNCTLVSVTNSQVDQICVLNGMLTKALYASGMAVTYISQSSLDPTNTMFTLSNRGCPQVACHAVMDLVLVFDSSGSITPAGWDIIINFAHNVTSLLTISPTMTMVGLVSFGNDGHLIATLQDSRQNIDNYIGGMPYLNEWTCIGCGLNVAGQIFTQSPRGTTVKRVVVLMTDGANNKPDDIYATYLQDAADSIKKSMDAQVFAIGVGDLVVQSEMDIIRSDIPGVTTYMPVTSLSQLNSIVNQVVAATCTSFPDVPICSCDGFCGVRTGECICPSCRLADPNNSCQKVSPCSVDTNYGCAFINTICQPKSGCTLSTCQPANGLCEDSLVTDCGNGKCVALSLTTHSCANNYNGTCTLPSDCPVSANKCLLPTCVNSRCVTVAMNCDDGNLCTEDVCDNGICYHNIISCDDQNMCTNDTCIPFPNNGTYGCTHTRACPPTGPCDNSTCNPISGCSTISIACPRPTGSTSSCYSVTCDKVKGCINTQITTGVQTDGTSCSAAAVVIGLSALGIGLIIGGTVILALLIAGLLARRRMNRLASRARNSATTDVKENELYEAAYGGGENPLFAEKQTQ